MVANYLCFRILKPKPTFEKFNHKFKNFKNFKTLKDITRDIVQT